MICLLLTLRMAHKSLMLKLKARETKRPVNLSRQMSSSSDNLLHLMYAQQEALLNDSANKSENENYENAEMKMVDFEDNEIKDQNTNYFYKRPRNSTMRSSVCSVGEPIDTRVDKVYTVGCFDLFHHGHVKIINRMREIGKKVIVGVHDSRRLVGLLIK